MKLDKCINLNQGKKKKKRGNGKNSGAHKITLS